MKDVCPKPRHKPGPDHKFKPAKVASALLTCKGNVSAAARHLECARSTVVLYTEEFDSVAAALAQAKEESLDQDERTLEALVNLELRAINIETRKAAENPEYKPSIPEAGHTKWRLARRGRKRGWGEHQTVEHQGGVDTNIRFFVPEPPP